MTDEKPAGDGYDEKTVAELQDELRARDLPVSGNKDELVSRLQDDDAKPADAEPSEDTQPIEGTPEVGGSLGSIERNRAEAEAEERAAIVEYEEATYKNKDAALLLRDIADELGLTRPEDYAELTRLNGLDLNSRIDAGKKVRLPQQYSYVDVEHVTGGAVKA